MEYFKVSLLLVASFALAIHAGIIAKSDESSSDESLEMEDLVSEIQRGCRNKTGNDEAFNNMVASVSNAPICIASKMDIEGFARDAPGLDDSTRVEFFSTYCPQFNDSLSCMTPIVSEFRKCLDQEEIELVDIVVGVVPEALNLICKDNGEIFFNEDANFQKCLENWTQYAEACLQKISNATEAMDLSNYGEKQCNEVVEVRSCFQSKVTECNAPRLIELFDVFYRPVVKASPCTKYIQLEGNSAAKKEEDNRIEVNEI